MIVNDELVYPQIALPRTRIGERERESTNSYYLKSIEFLSRHYSTTRDPPFGTTNVHLSYRFIRVSLLNNRPSTRR